MIRRLLPYALLLVSVSAPIATLSGCQTEACSDLSTTGGGAVVVAPTANCREGNACVANKKGEVACRLTCASQDGKDDGCPQNYYCTAGKQGVTYCEKNTVEVTAAAGTWGAPCSAKRGGVASEDCNVGAGFGCYADGPDSSGICTLYNCTADSDCKGGYACTTVNKGPSADAKKRTIGETQRVCLPRTYCSSCEVDVDCGAGQVCAKDGAGKRFCTSACDNDKGCRDEATCRPRRDNGEDVDGNVCVPRYGTCTGKGELCAPCRADSDCANGAICTGEALGNYNTEKFCTKKVDSCDACKGLTAGFSDPYLRGNLSGVGCLSKADSTLDFPINQCFGLVQFGSSPDSVVLGCYTPKKTTDR